MSERVARKFHETYERLAPSFGYETRIETREFDPNSKNGKLMIAVCGEVVEQLEAENAKLRKSLKHVRCLLELQEFNVTHQICDCGCCLAIAKAVGDE